MTIVLGVPGAGKSTVLAALKGKQGCTLVNYGDLMFDIASKKKYVAHRDGLAGNTAAADDNADRKLRRERDLQKRLKRSRAERLGREIFVELFIINKNRGAGRGGETRAGDSRLAAASGLQVALPALRSSLFYCFGSSRSHRNYI